MAKDTLTPREMFVTVQKIAEDGIFNINDFIEYFNNSVDEVNTDIGTNFPRINTKEFDIPYPNITIEPNYNIKGSYSDLTESREVSNSVSHNFDSWIRFLRLEVTESSNNSSVFGIYQFSGGDLINTKDNKIKNIYRLLISYSIQDGQILLNDPIDAFKVFRLSSGSVPLTFGFQLEGTSINVFVKPTNAIQQLVTPIIVSEYSGNNQDNTTLINDIIVSSVLPPTYISLDYFRHKFSLDAKWCNKLFIPIIIKTIRLYEGDTAELISLEQQISSKSLNSFRNEVRKTLPLVLYDPKKKYGDLK